MPVFEEPQGSRTVVIGCLSSSFSLQGLEQAVMAGDTSSRGGGETGDGSAAEKKKAKKDAAAEDLRLERLLRCGAYEVRLLATYIYQQGALALPNFREKQVNLG